MFALYVYTLSLWWTQSNLRFPSLPPKSWIWVEMFENVQKVNYAPKLLFLSPQECIESTWNSLQKATKLNRDSIKWWSGHLLIFFIFISKILKLTTLKNVLYKREGVGGGIHYVNPKIILKILLHDLLVMRYPYQNNDGKKVLERFGEFQLSAQVWANVTKLFTAVIYEFS